MPQAFPYNSKMVLSSQQANVTVPTPETVTYGRRYQIQEQPSLESCALCLCRNLVQQRWRLVILMNIAPGISLQIFTKKPEHCGKKW